jgi:hypothetical protein
MPMGLAKKRWFVANRCQAVWRKGIHHRDMKTLSVQNIIITTLL